MDSLSSRYALAMFDICIEKDKLGFVLECVKTLKNLIIKDKEILSYFSSKFVSLTEKETFIDKTFSLLDEDLRTFLKIIIKNHRSYYLLDILTSFISIGNEKLNILEGNVVTTIKLEEHKIKEIEDALSIKLKQKVELENIVDPKIIGGVKVVINDRVYDGSIKSRLESLKNNLKERRAS